MKRWKTKLGFSRSYHSFSTQRRAKAESNRRPSACLLTSSSLSLDKLAHSWREVIRNYTQGPELWASVYWTRDANAISYSLWLNQQVWEPNPAMLSLSLSHSVSHRQPSISHPYFYLHQSKFTSFFLVVVVVCVCVFLFQIYTICFFLFFLYIIAFFLSSFFSSSSPLHRWAYTVFIQSSSLSLPLQTFTINRCNWKNKVLVLYFIFTVNKLIIQGTICFSFIRSCKHQKILFAWHESTVTYYGKQIRTCQTHQNHFQCSLSFSPVPENCIRPCCI